MNSGASAEEDPGDRMSADGCGVDECVFAGPREHYQRSGAYLKSREAGFGRSAEDTYPIRPVIQSCTCNLIV